MPINLSKGQKVDLTKGNPGLKNIMVGLGWDVNAFDSGVDFDLDAAAFMLGAKAVQMGTHFVATEESIVHENYKNAIIKAKDIDSRVTGRSTGHPVRALRNQMTKKYLDLEHLTLGGLRKAVVDGDVTNGSVMAGQSAAMVKEIMSCKDLIQKLVSETDALIGGKGFYE
mgnify:CR=1 FL=1